MGGFGVDCVEGRAGPAPPSLVFCWPSRSCPSGDVVDPETWPTVDVVDSPGGFLATSSTVLSFTNRSSFGGESLGSGVDGFSTRAVMLAMFGWGLGDLSLKMPWKLRPAKQSMTIPKIKQHDLRLGNFEGRPYLG